ncbi:MAG TPA: phosphoribosyltransferase family protein [Dehalococcoidia bacterium]|jgi:orotate phosphoribosyltransferase/uridine monophosphate synthetase|nr:phosphoribosyltransferase family protein [Dehalococcoidia bacterium]
MPQNTGNLWLAKALWDLGAVQFGDYTIGRTTQHSPVYVNLRLLISNPRALARAARVMQEEVRTRQAMLHKSVKEFQRVCGIPFGGLHLATAFALRSRVPMVYVHPAKESNGNRVWVEGRFEPGETVLLIDDLVTSGGGIVETAAFLKANASLNVKDVLVLLDRQEGAREQLKSHGYNLISILGLEPMLNYLMASGLIGEDDYDRSIEYMQNRRAQRGG